MSSVFVIVNEWADVTGRSGVTVVDWKYHTTQESAWRALREIAHSYDDDLDYDATSLQYENPSSGLEFEEYYIQELTKGTD